MVRCPTCGIRLGEVARRCPRHGEATTPPPPEDAPALIPTPELSGYQVGRCLGQGGFGAVFEARRLSDGVRVAIKVARSDQPSAAARLALEGQALAAIGAPVVPRLWASGHLEHGPPYLVLEYLDWPTLAERMAQQLGPLPGDLFASLAPAIVQLVEISHQRGFLHCDLKPENIFVGCARDDDDAAIGARLFDFGLARPFFHPAAMRATVEPIADDETAGTPEYMAPEQCDGRGAVDGRTDVYALGVILYEMCDGAPPFWGRAAEVQQSQRARRPALLSRTASVAPALEEVIMRCLAKDPARRFPSVTEMRAALAAALPASAAKRTAARSETAAVAAPGEPPAEVAPTRAAPARPAPPARERASVALVTFALTGSAEALRTTLASVGAHLAHAAGAQYAVVFGREFGDNPTRAAAQAARLFVDRGLCLRALVDLATVAIETRSDGSRRYQGARFRRRGQYPDDGDPGGVLLSAAAADVLPNLLVAPLPGVEARFLVRPGDDSQEGTSMRAEAALVGRDSVLAELLDAARWATTVREPTITTLIGDPGYGKSHLAAVLVQRLQSTTPRPDVLIVRGQEAFGLLGEQTTREILRRGLGLALGAPIAPDDLGRGLLAERLGATVAREVWAGVAVVMGWASPDHPDIGAVAAAPGALRSAAARAAGELLRAQSRRTPLAVIIDDAQFLDETALDALEFAALQEAACPLWICVLARPAFADRRSGWGGRAARRQEIRLPVLDSAAASELARRLLLPMTNIPATIPAKLAERTEGVPLLLVELVRGLKRGGLVRKSDKTNTWFLATEELEQLPDLPLVEWLASSETKSLPPELAAHARIASVLGPEFAASELEGVMHVLERGGVTLETQLDAGIGIERLTASGLLVTRPNLRIGFRHALLRETIYRTVPTDRCEQIHRAAHEYFLAAPGRPDEDRLPRVALHAARSGLHAEAAAIYLELARRARRRHAYLDAELLYGSAVENLAGDDRDDGGGVPSTEAVQGRGLMRFRLGRLEDGLKDLTGARERAHAAADRAKEVELLLDESMVLDWLNDYGRSAALTAHAEQVYRDSLTRGERSPLLDARIAYAQGRTLHRQEKETEAAPFFATSARLAEPLGAEGYETMMQARNLLGWAYAMTGRYEDSERTFGRNIDLCESAGDMFNLTVALQNRGILSMLVTRLDRMLGDYRRMISIARENAFGLAEMVAQKDIGEVFLMGGNFADAERETRRAIDVSRRAVGDRSRATVSAELLLARLLVFQGRTDDATALSAAIRRRQSEARADGLTESDFGPGEALMHRMVDLACAPPGVSSDAEIDRDWAGLMVDARAITQQPQDTVEMLEIWGLTALRAGRTDQAVQRLAEALDLARNSAAVVAGRVQAHLSLAEAAARSSDRKTG
ncbi:MAG TPA: protein kinase [Polyangia bacterium]|nr:protein kinase [Polyangia bacterium]